MTDDTQAISDRGRLATTASDALRRAPVDKRIAWLTAAAERLSEEVAAARAHLARETGLSDPMVDWAARTTLGTVTADALRTVADEAKGAAGDPISMLAVVLAGNLFTASVRAVFVPLLLGVPVLAKASSRETVFVSMLAQALQRTDPKLGQAMQLVVFEGGDVEREAALFEAAAAAAIYGSDETLEAIRARHPDVLMIPHGHGVSAAYCSAEALRTDRLEDTVRALALDVCAYDQRGCLSPQIIYVDEAPDCPAEQLAHRLARDGLEPLAKELPRGPLPIDVGAAQAQWRGLAEIEGKLVVGEGFAIAIRRATDRFRSSPGYRNVTLTPVAGLWEAVTALEPLRGHLKCIGADAASLGELKKRLRESQVSDAHACALGSMQTPAFDAPADGKPVWQGLVR